MTNRLTCPDADLRAFSSILMRLEALSSGEPETGGRGPAPADAGLPIEAEEGDRELVGVRLLQKKKGPKIIIVPTCNMICKLEVKTHHTICGNDKFLFLVVKGHLFSVFRMTSTPTIFRRKLVMENAPLLLQYVTKNVSKFSNYDQLLLSLHRKKRKKIAIVVVKTTPIKMVK